MRTERRGGPDLRAVIMAGGSGTRFWPLSRSDRAKQFLPIVSDRTMLEETVARLAPLVPPRRVYTIAGVAPTRQIARLLPEVPAANRLVEPAARNTAPSLLLATARIHLLNPRAVVAALPADHLILDADGFRRRLAAAAAVAAAEDVIVTFGIPPTHPATGYGYIQFDPAAARQAGGFDFRPALGFKEKPGLEEARAFLAEGGYAWNSGMFVWQARTFADKLRRHAPEWHGHWVDMLAALRRNDRRRLAAIFRDVPSTSIDYALMEKAAGVLVVDGDFGWSDVGAWSSLAAVWPADESGNAVKGETLLLDASGCLVHSAGRLTAAVGVRDLVIVVTDDAVLVCAKDRDQQVKDVVAVLRDSGRGRFLAAPVSAPPRGLSRPRRARKSSGGGRAG